MRLFSFLCEVMIEQRLNYSTMLYAMQLFDQVVARYEDYRKDQILLIGSACLTLACKLEEIFVSRLMSLLSLSCYFSLTF